MRIQRYAEIRAAMPTHWYSMAPPARRNPDPPRGFFPRAERRRLETHVSALNVRSCRAALLYMYLRLNVSRGLQSSTFRRALKGACNAAFCDVLQVPSLNLAFGDFWRVKGASGTTCASPRRKGQSHHNARMAFSCKRGFCGAPRATSSACRMTRSPVICEDVPKDGRIQFRGTITRWYYLTVHVAHA